MTDTPTREQVQQSLDYVTELYVSAGQPMSLDQQNIHHAARAWLEGPTVTDEMIERVAAVLDDLLEPDDLDTQWLAGAIVRAALEVTE